MNTELELIAGQIQKAAKPEAVFGALEGPAPKQLAALKTIYHRLARLTHPDMYPLATEKSVASTAFARLAEWFAVAERAIRSGSYGAAAAPAPTGLIQLQTHRHVYTLDGSFFEDDLYTLYQGTFEENGRPAPVRLKVASDPANNDLAKTDAAVTRRLLGGKESAKFSAYVPSLIESFVISDKATPRLANVYRWSPGWYTLEQVRERYPDGIDPKDMAWIWRRLLVALGYAHINEVVHGAVLPANVWIHPEGHGLLLDCWAFAALDPDTTGAHVAAIDPHYQSWYPPEVLRKAPATPGADIFQAALAMAYVLGGTPPEVSLPTRVPPRIAAFLRGCALPNPHARPQDAWGLKEEFDQLLDLLWGERKFHQFFM